MKNKQIYQKVYNSFNQEYTGWKAVNKILTTLFGCFLIAWGIIIFVLMAIKEIRIDDFHVSWYIYGIFLILIRVGFYVLLKKD